MSFIQQPGFRATEPTAIGRSVVTASTAAAIRTLLDILSSGEITAEIAAAISAAAASYATASQGALADSAVQPADLSDYVLADGTTPFTGVVVGVTPTADSHLATKGYIDGVVALGGSGGAVVATPPNVSTPGLTVETIAGQTAPALEVNSPGGSGGDLAYVDSSGSAGFMLLVLGPRPDNTAVGGNTRGTKAVDLQTERSSGGQVASGSYSALIGGYGNTASGFGAVAINGSCVASGQYSFARGHFSTASGYLAEARGYLCQATGYGAIAEGSNASAWVAGMRSHSSGGRYSNPSTGDFGTITLAMSGASSTPTCELLSGGSRLTVPSGKGIGFVVELVGICSDGTTGCVLSRKGLVINRAGTTSLIGAVQTVGTDIDPSGATSVSVTADDTNDAVKIEATQPTGEHPGATGDASTDTITLVGHPFANGSEVILTSLTGGAGLSTGVRYFVRDVSGDSFKLTTTYQGNAPIDFTTNITDATIDYLWEWHATVTGSVIDFALY